MYISHNTIIFISDDGFVQKEIEKKKTHPKVTCEDSDREYEVLLLRLSR